MSEYKGWHQIDLHSHTLGDVDNKGKIIESNYTHERFYKYIKEEGVSLKAVTNHNSFNLINHIKHAIICDMANINYLHGVEFDLKFNDSPFHAVVLLSPRTDLIKYECCLSEMLGKKIKEEDVTFNLKDFAKLHGNTEFILIPHAIKEKGVLNEKDVNDEDQQNVQWVIDTILNGNSMPFLLENTKDYHKYSVNNKIQEISENYELEAPSIVSSDYAFVDDEQRAKAIEEKEKYYIFSKPTYRGLEIAIRNYKTRISKESDLIKRDNHIDKIVIDKTASTTISSKSVSEISLSTGLNVIIGNSGSGKTLLLNELYRYIKKKNLLKIGNNDNNKYPYKSFLNSIDVISAKQSLDTKLEIEEIPNAYEEIIKATESIDSISELFGINYIPHKKHYLEEYINNVNKYEENYIIYKDSNKSGKNNFDTITKLITFIDKNQRDIDTKLISIAYNPKKYNEIDKKINTLSQFDKEKPSYIETFSNIMEISDRKEYRESFVKLIKSLEDVYKEVNKEIKRLKTQLIPVIIDKTIHEHVQVAVKNYREKLGGRERQVSSSLSNLSDTKLLLNDNVKKAIKSEIEMDKINLSYPLKLVRKNVESNNNNSYARLSIQEEELNIKEVVLSDTSIIENENIKTKLRNIGDVIDFSDSKAVKAIIPKFIESKLRLSDLIKEPRFILEIKIDEEFKDTSKINPGDIAKAYMKYYFEDVINKSQPNVIFIDQPENDVDKQFITEVLSEFIKKNKNRIQFIITTHDPILTVNSDANLIILAERDSNNHLIYSDFAIEDVDVENSNEKMTDVIADILDGGKENIKNRYQIYGGNIDE